MRPSVKAEWQEARRSFFRHRAGRQPFEVVDRIGTPVSRCWGSLKDAAPRACSPLCVSLAGGDGSRPQCPCSGPKSVRLFRRRCHTARSSIDTDRGDTFGTRRFRMQLPLTYWLELKSVTATRSTAGDVARYTLKIAYQIFYVPVDPRKLDFFRRSGAVRVPTT